MPNIMRSISATYRAAMLYREHALEGTGLGPYQTPYLMVLYRKEGISQEALSRDLNLHKSTVARQLMALEKDGFVFRTPDPADHRQILVFPTEKARKLEERIRSILSGWSDFLLEDFTPEERETALELMNRIASKADQGVKEQNL